MKSAFIVDLLIAGGGVAVYCPPPSEEEEVTGFSRVQLASGCK